MGPFPAPVVAAGVQVVVGVVVGVVADRTAMAGVAAESAAAAGQMVAVLDSWRGRTAKATESEVVAMGLPDVRVVSVRMQLGTTSSGTVVVVVVEVVAVESVVSAFGPGRSRQYCSGRGYVVGRLSSRPEARSGFGEVWWVV